MSLSNVAFRFQEVKEFLQSGKTLVPMFADLHTSNLCNHQCDGCAYSEVHTGEMMSSADHFSVINQLLDMGVRAFDFAGGGEPLMLPYIIGIWDRIVERGGNFSLITNGSFLNQSIIEYLVRYGTYVRISMEASSPGEYSRYKNVSEGEYHKVVSNVNRLVEARNQTPTKDSLEIGLKFAVGTTLRGRQHYATAIDLAEQMGVDNVQFKILRHFPQELSPQAMLEEDLCLKEVLSELNPSVRVRSWMLPLKEAQVPQCVLNPLHVVVDYEGNVYLCCYYYYRKDQHLIGNMLSEPIKSFWMGERHRRLISQIDREECRKADCKFFRHHHVVEDYMKRNKAYYL